VHGRFSGRADCGTGRAERLPQGGQVSEVPGPPGRVVQERADLVQGGEDLTADLLHGRIASTETRIWRLRYQHRIGAVT